MDPGPIASLIIQYTGISHNFLSVNAQKPQNEQTYTEKLFYHNPDFSPTKVSRAKVVNFLVFPKSPFVLK